MLPLPDRLIYHPLPTGSQAQTRRDCRPPHPSCTVCSPPGYLIPAGKRPLSFFHPYSFCLFYRIRPPPHEDRSFGRPHGTCSLPTTETRIPSARGLLGHRLFVSTFMLASKVICDDTYSNKLWSIVAQGMFQFSFGESPPSTIFQELNINPACSR